jgi:hypothetical protein
MGMYTEYALKFSISKDNQEVLGILKYMTDNEVLMVAGTPHHPLFGTNRWDIMAKSGRSFICEVDYLDTVDVMLIGEFKNYCGEIRLFLDWIKPHLEGYLIGHSHYEEDLETVPYFIENEL